MEPRLKATSVVRSPRYWGHFFLAARQNDHSFSLKKKKPLVNTVTSLIRPNVFGPLVTVLTGFRTKIFQIASCYQTSKVPSRNFGGRQFFVRKEILCLLTAVPRQVIPQKNFLQLTFLVILKISRLICEQGCKNEKLVIIFRPNANKASVTFKRLP